MKRGRSTSAPKYRLHKATGQAVVSINGKDIYLGKHGSESSLQKYRQSIADLWTPPGINAKLNPTKTNEPVTVAKLAVEYAKYAIRKHGEQSTEWKQIQLVLKTIRSTCGHLAAEDFGPLRFENFRQELVNRGLSRGVVKRKSNYVIKMFQQGVKFELIPVEFWQRLLSLGPVEMKEKPMKKRGAVDLKIVKATQEELTPVLADMISIHLLIGARPSEVCNMRPCDIDRSKEIWTYTPATHKTENYGHSRSINIGPKAQAVLSRYLLREPQAFCFSPSEAYEQHMQLRSENRKTPLNQGNRPKVRKPKTFKPKYDKDSYRRAIERAALRAFPIPDEMKDDGEKVADWKFRYIWKPNQLRKLAATEARKQMDLETAQIVLGHSSKKTTEKYYAEMDNDRAIEFARKYG